MRDKNKKICKSCGKEYLKDKRCSESNWAFSKFCSWDCRNKERTRIAYAKPQPKKICKICGKEYIKNRLLSISDWNKRMFCSWNCSHESMRIYPNKEQRVKAGIERARKKGGWLKRGTPEWLKRISSTTKDAMQKPDIQRKIRATRSPLSEDHKSAISVALAGKMPKNTMFSNNGYGHFQNGDYENSKGTMYFRSKWEANYALYLDLLKEHIKIKEWEYEVDYFVFDKIRHGTTRYLPDFKITNNDGSAEYHEIKGFLDSRSKTKLKRMAKYYPEVKLILIGKDEYYLLKKQIGKLCTFY